MDARVVSRLCLMVLLSGGLTAHANAALVNVDLVIDQDSPGCSDCTLSGPGTWNLVVEVSRYDNLGIVSYGIPLVDVTGVDHKSPWAQLDSDNFAPMGFSFARSADGASFLGASQDTVIPTPNMIYGFGQTADSFAALGLSPLGTQEQVSWEVPLVLAEGTYDIGSPPSVNTFSVDLFVNVFTATSIFDIEAAHVTGFPLVYSPLLDAEITIPVGETATHVFDAPYDPDLTDPAWTLTSFDGPDDALDPSIDPYFGNFQSMAEFQWDSTGTPSGTYHASIQFGDPFMGPEWHLGLVTIHIVPEPASALLFGLGVAGLLGASNRRRN